MKYSKKITLLLSMLLCFSSCKTEHSKPNPALASIDLKRGDLLLCSTESFGEVKFSLSCNFETRATFDLALSLLHSFEYAEAEKVFVKVIDMDPDCAMAYWGVAMTMYHSLWAPPGKEELEKGSKLLAIAETLPKSEIAQQYLDAIGVFYKDWKSLDHRTRTLLYENKMEEIYVNNKGDTEAAVFYALALRSSADPNDKTYKNQRESGEILETLFREEPNHPGIAHYIIHTYDYPELAALGLSTARRYAEIAPASAHAQHMPSHIFTRLGLWQESINTNINSASSATCYAESVNPNANWAQEIHAVDYLVYAHLQMGDNQKAIAQLKEMEAVTEVFPKDHFAATYALTAMPVRMVLENKQWEAASNLELPSINFPWETLHWETAILHFAKALGSSHIGDTKAADAELQTLETLYKKLVDANEAYKAGQVNVQIHAARAWIELAKDNKEDALVLMKMASELESQTSKHPVTPGEVLPADELLGDMLLALNKPIDALEAYEINLKGHPNRFNGLYGAAIAAKQSGDKEKAIIHFRALVDVTESSNSDRTEVIEAKEFIAKHSSI